MLENKITSRTVEKNATNKLRENGQKCNKQKNNVAQSTTIFEPQKKKQLIVQN